MVHMDLISLRDMEKKEVEALLKSADEIHSGRRIDLSGKILATLFFEASTRTRLSFQSAALRNMMGYIDFSPDISSIKKGESFSDTIKIISGYCDILAIRHPDEGTARLAADLTEKPVINAGDGGNQHPSQTLIDLFAIQKIKGRIKDLNITLLGDLKHARAMRSLLYGLGMFRANVTLAAPHGLAMEKDYVDEIKKKFGIKIAATDEPDYSNADVLYVCRIQQERFADPYEAKTMMAKFMVKKEDLKDAKEDLAILHPLPKINEIDERIDRMKQARYFEQAHFGVPVRQAVLEHVLRD